MFRSATVMALLCTSSAALAAPPAQVSDVRCFLVAAEMADTKDKEVEAAASIMMFYYLGKIDGQEPGANVEALVEREAATLSEEEKKNLLGSCSAEVERRGNQLSGSAG